MNGAIFLSAGVPDPKRGPQYAKTADTVAITAAVSALLHVTLGRRLIVWGGQPAITPMIWVVSEGLGLDYAGWVKLYQSRHFKDEFPEDNQRFGNVTYTDDIDHDREKSLRSMRERMFTEHIFSTAVFIGGMGGIVDEFDLMQQLQPRASVLPIISTGGAVLDIAKRTATSMPDLTDDLDYVALFHRHLGISVKEQRYRHPDDQPARLEDRLWRPAASIKKGTQMKEPGLDDRHRDKDGRIQQKRSDTKNGNLSQPIPGFASKTTLKTMREKTGKTSEGEIRKAAKKRR